VRNNPVIALHSVYHRNTVSILCSIRIIFEMNESRLRHCQPKRMWQHADLSSFTIKENAGLKLCCCFSQSENVSQNLHQLINALEKCVDDDNDQVRFFERELEFKMAWLRWPRLFISRKQKCWVGLSALSQLHDTTSAFSREPSFFISPEASSLA
jgi:hypothetical protein